ncbi:hypothetical protein [Paraburkholderia sp. J41]|uniref:hypothetical protein n=1 Tax=Paraburkholderia sp. J41 TaxID=2805433 RepID=UPI002AC34A4D|nr:hypothetical protein [Paraburkholderia sp. J41]
MDAPARGIEPQFRGAPRSTPYGDDYSPQPEPGYGRRAAFYRNSREAFYVCAALAIIAGVVGSFWAMNRDNGSQTDNTRVTMGAVADPPAPAQTVKQPAEPVESVAVAAAPVKPVVVAPVAGATGAGVAASAQETPARPRAVTAQIAPPVAATDDTRTGKSTMYPRADLARNLAIAHAGLDKDNLALAHSAIARVLSEQPRNSDAQAMREDLASREADRDSLLGFARLCASQQNWNCAWQNAGHALTIDSSSHEARDLLSQAIAERGAAPTPPQPDVPAVPQAH